MAMIKTSGIIGWVTCLTQLTIWSMGLPPSWSVRAQPVDLRVNQNPCLVARAQCHQAKCVREHPTTIFVMVMYIYIYINGRMVMVSDGCSQQKPVYCWFFWILLDVPWSCWSYSQSASVLNRVLELQTFSDPVSVLKLALPGAWQARRLIRWRKIWRAMCRTAVGWQNAWVFDDFRLCFTAAKCRGQNW